MEKKKKEDRKKRFRSLILLLFITIIMFGTSTYAWFTANRVVTISSIDVNVQASNGIQISTGKKAGRLVVISRICDLIREGLQK